MKKMTVNLSLLSPLTDWGVRNSDADSRLLDDARPFRNAGGFNTEDDGKWYFPLFRAEAQQTTAALMEARVGDLRRCSDIWNGWTELEGGKWEGEQGEEA